MTEHPSIGRIAEDLQSGLHSRVPGTPTFCINGVLYRGPWEKDALLAAHEAASQGA